MNVAYVRVSSVDQNESRQLEELKKRGIDKWFIEKVSGKNINDRNELVTMMDFVREGDTVFIHDLSRLARSTADLLSLIKRLQEKNVNLISDKESIDTSTATGKLMITMIGAINEFERENLLERQREGIAIAKQLGKYKGRKQIRISDFENHYQKYLRREISKVQLAKELSVSRPTLDKLIQEHIEQQDKED